ncbi:MAG: putative rane protein [Firmicutes bacterium]|nr:putative rane protein [Bacillota bacterium]
MNYFMTLLLMGLVILIHEFGHFVAAYWAKIPIRIFSIGFGPTLWKKKIGATEYRLSLLPFGGYVLPNIETQKEFFQISPWKRIIMAAGGPIASAILPLLCLAIINVYWHGFSVDNFLFKPVLQSLSVLNNMAASLHLMVSQPDQLTGIVGIVAQGGEFIGISALNALNFLAIISLDLFILNLLPIPVLDGGKILLYFTEKLHPVFLKLHFPLAIAGWIFVLGLTVFTLFTDIRRLIV